MATFIESGTTGSPLPSDNIIDPNTVVYVIQDCGNGERVVQGTVIRTIIDMITTGTTVTYFVRLYNAGGTIQFSIEDVFLTKTEAMTEYEARVY